MGNKSADMWDSLNYSLAFVTMVGDTEVTFVGHSKGGGEAIAAADYTDRNAITFNAANFKFDKYVSGKGKGTIVNYYVKGEILEATIGTATIGNTKWLPQKYYPESKWYYDSSDRTKAWIDAAIANHMMEAVKTQLNAKQELGRKGGIY